MENTKFEVRFTTDFWTLVESGAKISARLLFAVAWIYAALMLWQMIRVMLFLPHVPTTSVLPTIIMYFLGFLFGVSAPLISVGVRIAKVKKAYGGTMPETRIVFGDTVVVTQGNVSMTLEYSKINKTRRLKRSYYLGLAPAGGVVFRHNSFTQGNFEDWKAFMRQKNPKLYVAD